MWVDDDRKCLFIAVPKTGSTSVIQTMNMGEFGKGARIPPKPPVYHASIAEIKNKETEIPEFSFAFVRNPWYRLLSLFFESANLKDGNHHAFSPKIKEFETFNDFVIGLRDAGLHEERHFLPCSHFVTIDGEIAVDFIGRFETLQEDFNKCLDTIGLERKPLVHWRGTRYPSDDMSSYYNQEAKDIVAEIYEEDIRRFGYEF